jgi:hypothetical protein
VGEVSYKGHRYPAEIIAHCVWLYHRFPVSLREVEELMLVRGVIVSYETIRQWCAKFGPAYAADLEAAGELGAAYAWYMRSADWLSNRDMKGARDSWERARAIADRLPADEEGVTSKRIAPRAQLTFKPWLVGEAADHERCFDELRELATQSGDLLSLAMGMAGRVTSLILTHGRPRDAAAMASETHALDRQDRWSSFRKGGDAARRGICAVRNGRTRGSSASHRSPARNGARTNRQ